MKIEQSQELLTLLTLIGGMTAEEIALRQAQVIWVGETRETVLVELKSRDGNRNIFLTLYGGVQGASDKDELAESANQMLMHASQNAQDGGNPIITAYHPTSGVINQRFSSDYGKVIARIAGLRLRNSPVLRYGLPAITYSSDVIRAIKENPILRLAVPVINTADLSTGLSVLEVLVNEYDKLNDDQTPNAWQVAMANVATKGRIFIHYNGHVYPEA